MNDFENKIINLSSLNASGPDPAVFLTRFRGQQEKEMIQKKRVVSCINAFAFIFFIAIFTVSQFKDCLLYTSTIPLDKRQSSMT